MTNSRTKGANGEREVCKILTEMSGYKVVRSLESVRAGGCDIEWGKYNIEVKRKKVITEGDIKRFWRQATEQCDEDREPVLFYRADREPWNIMVFNDDKNCCQTMDLQTFKEMEHS